MSMLDELRDTLRSIQDARAVIVVHPDDEQSVRTAVNALALVAPRIEVAQYAQQGQALVFPDPSAPQMVVP